MVAITNNIDDQQLLDGVGEGEADLTSRLPDDLSNIPFIETAEGVLGFRDSIHTTLAQ